MDYLASSSSSFPKATATQNSTCRLERSSKRKQKTVCLAWPGHIKKREKAKRDEAAPRPPSHTPAVDTHPDMVRRGPGRGQKREGETEKREKAQNRH